MRTSHSRRLSFDPYYAPDDVQEVLTEESWTGPPTLPPTNESSWPRASDRSNRTFLSTFSLPAAAWRPSPASTPTSEPRQSHYRTVSSSLAKRRATVDAAIPFPEPEFAPSVPLPQLPRRYSENAATLPEFPRPPSRIGGVKRKPVPALAIEDDLDTVEDPRWDGKAAHLSAEATRLPMQDSLAFEERVRSLSLEELFQGETGLGFLVKEVAQTGKQPFGRLGRSHSAQSTKSGSTGENRLISPCSYYILLIPFLCFSDSASSDSYSLLPLNTLPYGSNPSSEPSSTRASTPHSFEPIEKAKPRRPFALIRRRQSRPLEAHGSIIPSLATRATPSKKEEEDLMEAWMEIMVGEEDESPKEEKPALIFQSRPRKTSSNQSFFNKFVETDTKSRPESIAEIASILPPLRYSSTSRRSSIISLPPLDVSEAWNNAGFDVREDSEAGSDEFHDAKYWSSDHQVSAFQTLESVPESPVPHVVPPPRSSSIHLSPLLQQTNLPQVLPATKKRHSRSLSLDFLSSSASKILPPRPPKSARRLSRPDIALLDATRPPLVVAV
ncbi:uncharacterized protein JCM6883_005521 [Sporobolomyces salmoneus]|uniref:uncharacterized protein n=1 Tax=Sporobolomyces salmoneus TaxID=183962 RepID=UPI00316CE766